MPYGCVLHSNSCGQPALIPTRQRHRVGRVTTAGRTRDKHRGSCQARMVAAPTFQVNLLSSKEVAGTTYEPFLMSRLRRYGSRPVIARLNEDRALTVLQPLPGDAA